MSEWFSPLDDAIGGVQNAFTGLFGVAGDAAGDAAGGLFGGLFGGLGNWLFQVAALGAVAWVVVQVM